MQSYTVLNYGALLCQMVGPKCHCKPGHAWNSFGRDNDADDNITDDNDDYNENVNYC